MFLDSATKSIELVVDSAATTNPLQIIADFTDDTGLNSSKGSSVDLVSTGTAAVTIVSAPASSGQSNTRKINLINIYNADTAAKKVTVRLNNNGSIRQIIVSTLQIGDTLGYEFGVGWYVQDTNGNRKMFNAPISAIVATLGIGRNLIVNGSCAIDQVNSGALITPVSGSYPIDNVFIGMSAASKLQTQQTVSFASLGGINAITYSVLASYSAATTEVFYCVLPVEGLNMARLQWGTANALPASLQFKARASVAGTYSAALGNAAYTESYPFTFVLAANTDTLVTIPNIPGCTTGSWPTTNISAAELKFDLGSGTNFKSTANSWQAGSYNGVTGTTNLVSQPNGSTLTIGDVQLEVGSNCTQFERKLYDQDLRECQRYLPYFSNPSAAQLSFFYGFWDTSTAVIFNAVFPVSTRVPVTGIQFSTLSNFTAHNPGVSNPVITSLTMGSGQTFISSALNASVASGGSSVGAVAQLNNSTANSFIYFTGARI